METLVESTLEKARKLRRPTAKLENFRVCGEALKLVPPSLAREKQVLPLVQVRDTVLLACLAEEAVTTEDYFSKYFNTKVTPVIVGVDELKKAVTKHYGQSVKELSDLASQSVKRYQQLNSQQSKVETPVALLVQHTLEEAIRLRASDVHFEPYREQHWVKFRVDGSLVSKSLIPSEVYPAVVARIKILAKLDVAEKRRPQDGRATVQVGEQSLDLRVSVMPTLDGEGVVLRLLGMRETMLNIDALAFPKEIERRWLKLANEPNGIILVTGPTGSGKTSTLYATLRAVQKPELKILTLEDPVEARLDGVIQIPIRQDLGFDFEKGLRSALRHDPDLMLVGEIRDHESATIAVAASLTGHLLFASLHTNTACQAVTRLLDMGLKDYQVMTSLKGVLAQRLMRRLCPHCKTETTLSPEEHPDFFPTQVSSLPIFEAQGCEKCAGIGFFGRVPVFELLEITPPMRRLRGDDLTSQNLEKMACEGGFQHLHQSAFERVLEGITSLSEFYNLIGKGR